LTLTVGIDPSDRGRRRRFLGWGSSSPHDLAKAFTEPEGEGFVAVLGHAGPDDGAIVAHASVQPDGRGAAEIAIAVADELQGHHIGTALMAKAVGHARRIGLRRLSATWFTDNAPMRRLLRGAGCEIVSDEIDAGTEEMTLAVAP
jgi:RimJ/RimL family protein N-acetyltransferase